MIKPTWFCEYLVCRCRDSGSHEPGFGQIFIDADQVCSGGGAGMSESKFFDEVDDLGCIQIISPKAVAEIKNKSRSL